MHVWRLGRVAVVDSLSIQTGANRHEAPRLTSDRDSRSVSSVGHLCFCGYGVLEERAAEDNNPLEQPSAPVPHGSFNHMEL